LKPEIVITADGSSTLYSQAIDEHYHSTFGAIQESMHVFINAGLLTCKKNIINIFEVGFGTGLNCLLTYIHTRNTSQKVNYYSIEKYPLATDLALSLNYPEILGEDQQIFLQMHQSEWDKDVKLSLNFTLHKISGDLITFDCNHLPFPDLIYFDAFSPEKQPQLWDLSVFEKIHSRSHPGSILVTYCAKGSVRRSLNQAGFSTERIPGPPGKREMLRASVL
jgi:tRNA U34 5-methylaminomethyl-2-thiouridine-forming methyltransferase MnmC